MKKEQEKNESNGAEPSREMIKEVFNDMKKFKKYEDFLISVQAMKDTETVLQYPDIDIDKYENKYIKKYMSGSLNDSFVFSDKTIVKRKDEYGKSKNTGFFMPRMFFDNILNTIKFNA